MNQEQLQRLAVVYQPGSRAREYADLALTVYQTCPHQCRYCYCAVKWGPTYHSGQGNPVPRLIPRLEKDLTELRTWAEVPEILLSFRGDPYQPGELQYGLTRQVIELLIDAGLPFTVLTKGGTRAVNDFDLLADYGPCSFGTTLVFTEQANADQWEPGAPTIIDRIKAIQQAKERGIKTWVSLEPVIDPDQALALIRQLHSVVDHWKVGKLNHIDPPAPVDWIAFREEAKQLLQELGASYYLKDSLAHNAAPAAKSPQERR